MNTSLKDFRVAVGTILVDGWDDDQFGPLFAPNSNRERPDEVEDATGQPERWAAWMLASEDSEQTDFGGGHESEGTIEFEFFVRRGRLDGVVMRAGDHLNDLFAAASIEGVEFDAAEPGEQAQYQHWLAVYLRVDYTRFWEMT